MNVSPPDQPQQASRVNVYEVRPLGAGEEFELISDAISTGRLRFTKQHVAVGYATLHSGSNGSLIRVYDAAGQVIATHEQPTAARRATSASSGA